MSNDTITIDLSSIEPVAFEWDSNMNTTGISAQEVGSAYTTMIGGSSISATTITLGNITQSSGSSYTISTPYDDMETRLARLEKIIAEEEEVRNNCPAVQRAYEEYRLLYLLAKKNPGDLLTNE